MTTTQRAKQPTPLWVYLVLIVAVACPVIGVTLAMLMNNPAWLLLCLTFVFLAS